MDIFYLGHSSFKLVGKTASVITDPYNPTMLGLKFPNVSAEIVTVSHDHEDHSQHSLVNDVYKVIDSPGEYEVKGISFLGFNSYHDNKKGEIRGKNIIFVIEIDGIRVAHLGDLGHTLTESEINNLGDIDILMIPVGGTYTIGPKEAVEITRALDPNIVIPMHYQVAGISEKISENLLPVSDFLSEMGATGEEMPKLAVKEGSFDGDGNRVILLSRKS